MTYHQSSLNVYKQCPRKYQWTYLLKKQGHTTSDAHLKFGTAVHNLAEHEVLGMSSTVPKLIKMFADRGVDEDRLHAAYSKVQGACEWLSEQGIKLHATEMKINHRTLPLAGTLDLVCHKDNEYYILDWKTGKSYGTRLQLMFYAVLLASQYGVKTGVIKGGFIYLEHNKMLPIKWVKVSVEESEREIQTIIDAVENAEEFEPVRTALCNFCPYQKPCEAEVKAEMEAVMTGGEL